MNNQTPVNKKPYTHYFHCILYNNITTQGHRLGTAGEAAQQQKPYHDNFRDESLPAPVYNQNLTDADRAKERADRAAAAEARLKKQDPNAKKKKKKPADNNAPLTGPNSQPLMRWH